ncbi:MAG: MFS transporter [Planctomycetota bacterium]
MQAAPERPRSSRRVLAQLSAMMFLQSWTLGTWAMTIGTFITANTGEAGRGTFSAGFAGYSAAAGAVGGLIAPVLVGAISDRRLSAQYVLAIMNLGCAAASYGMFVCTSQTTFFLCLLGFFHCFVPAASLNNSISFRHLKNPESEFPILRVCAALGWITAGLFVGLAWPGMTGESIEDTPMPFAIGAVSCLSTALFCLTLPQTAPAANSGQASLRDALAAVGKGNRPLVVFLTISFLIAVPTMAYNNFANAFLNWEDYPNPAALLTLGQVSELTLLALTPWFVSRLGLPALFLVGAVSWGLRYFCFAATSLFGTDSTAILAILLHGPCFAWVFVTGPMYIDRIVQPELRGSIHGLYYSVMFGFANLAGAAVVGALQERLLTPEGVSPAPYDWTTFWSAFGGISLAAAALAFLLLKPSLRGEAEAPQRTLEDS